MSAAVAAGRPPGTTRSPAPAPVAGDRIVLAALLAAAGAIHVAMAPVHAPTSAGQAAAFAVVGGLQLAAAAVAVTSRRQWPLVATSALSLVALCAWAWSRRWELPLGLGGPEEIEQVDALCAGLEAAAIALAGAVLARRGRPVVSVPAAVPPALLVAGLTVAALAAPSTASHGGHEHDAAAPAHAHAAAGVGDACPEAGGDPVTEPQLEFPAPRLTADQAAALHALAAASEPLPCGATAAGHAHGHGHEEPASGAATPLSATDEARFVAEWAVAQAAATTLASTDAAAAAGYVKASPQAPGVGTHWINWALVDAPFDPARPSMLLFDERPGRSEALVGFSYWNRSSPGPPDGFTGPADRWHQHQGLCFIDGWLFAEDLPAADRCTGDWLDGRQLWMLHAWVVVDRPNPAGPFAGRHQALCPADREQVADAVRCDPVGA